ncbi:hypothetical protein H2201_009029 [Coniosporium apollinis]|uniref:Uncharacterized protein n=2 Tax=Coniosporium TaxID=2810619 RepID=A0ABQ9NH82_9PEZI|nr:hypothetical protein H2199_009086 [Cladosporium sp. JES 115]KAJ9654222.1 hypothetical protein H2201_009029 [Coniosporium apollinis]
MAQELWDLITEQLSSFSAENASQAFQIGLRENQIEHARLWRAIFRDDRWLDKATNEHKVEPVIISRNLHDYYSSLRSKTQKAKRFYMFLGARDMHGDLRFERELFFECLQPGSYNKATKEFEFESGIILNVEDVIWSPETYSIDPKKLVTYRKKQLESTYSFWRDSRFKFRTLRYPDIIGMGGPARKLKHVSPICGFNFTLPTGTEMQYIFSTPGRTEDLVPSGHKNGRSGICTGWKSYYGV